MSRQRANHYDRSRSRRTLVFAIRSTGAIVVMCVGLRAQPQPATSPEAIFGGDPKSAAVLRARGLELGYNLDHADALDAFVRAMAADPADRLLHGRTSVVIAHRLSTIRNADQVLVVNDGRIVQRGTHRELLSQEGMYRDLYLMQYRREVRKPDAVPEELAPKA